MSKEKDNSTFEALVIWQGFAKDIEKFTMDDFRGEVLPNYPEPYNKSFRKFFRIQRFRLGSECDQDYSRWVMGDNGKLRMLDSCHDSSG